MKNQMNQVREQDHCKVLTRWWFGLTILARLPVQNGCAEIPGSLRMLSPVYHLPLCYEAPENVF